MQHKRNFIDRLNEVIQQSLIDKIFVGDYATRRYAEPLQAYRDVITVHKDERELNQSLESILRFVDLHSANFWFGVTKEEDEIEMNRMYLIWVDLENVPLGTYWFRIKNIQFETMEIVLKVEVLRCYNEKEYNINEKFHISMRKLQEVLTLDNIWRSIQFSAVVLMAFVTFAASSLFYAAEYSIQLIYALSTLIDSLTPIILATFNFLARCVAGLYWLILMMWRGNPGPSLHHYSMPPLQDTRHKQYKPITLY